MSINSRLKKAEATFKKRLKDFTDAEIMDEFKRRKLTVHCTREEIEAELRSLGIDPEKVKLDE